MLGKASRAGCTLKARGIHMKHFRGILRVLGIAIATTSIVFCSHSPTEPVVAARDSIAVLSILPPPGASLPAGAPATFTATVSYGLTSAPSGLVSLFVADEDFQILSSTVPRQSANVVQGSGTVTLTDRVVIPQTGTRVVVVLVALLPAGVTGTDVIQQVSYLVGPSAPAAP